MKKTLTLIISIVFIICTMILSKYYSYQDKKIEIDTFNVRYEKYRENEIPGIDIATIINQAVDDNEKLHIKKDENGKYIQNDENSINIEIEITEFKENKIFTMEALYNGGIGEFVKYYGQIYFKATKVEYNSKGRVKYMLFEQVVSK